MARAVPSTAPIGITPPPIALPRAMRSGATPQRCTANIAPERPNPVFTSSAHQSRSYSAHSAVNARQNSGGGATQPPDPRMGSITNPATSRGSTTWWKTWSRR